MAETPSRGLKARYDGVMAIGPVVLAIPAFFVLIGVEALVARARRQQVYDLGDSLCNIGTGILDQVLGSLSRGIFPFTIYLVVYENWALFRLDPGTALPWILAFVGSDFLYYWWHRLSHEVNFMWACHVVHHQSPQFNLSVALRQNWLAGFTSSPFYVPLALLGVPPAVFALMKSINLLYQFWIHTRLIGNLGPLEWILNTPSHHRVHHGIDSQYLDRNYAGMFIVWDRWFGTFQAESHPPTYGTLAPFLGVSAPWAYLSPWVSLTRAAFHRGSFWRGLRHFFEHPASRPDGRRFDQRELDEQLAWPRRARQRPLSTCSAPAVSTFSGSSLWSSSPRWLSCSGHRGSKARCWSRPR